MNISSAPHGSAPKSEWRYWARDLRSQIDIGTYSEAVISGLRDWEPFKSSTATLIYLPLPEELDLWPLVDRSRGGNFYATRTPDKGGELTVHRLERPLQVHRLGFAQPHSSAPKVDPAVLDVLLLPGLAFDLWGTRLGRGAGYFDRLLASVSSTATLVGVTVSDFVVDRLPRESHDVPVCYLSTEEGVVKTLE